MRNKPRQTIYELATAREIATERDALLCVVEDLTLTIAALVPVVGLLENRVAAKPFRRAARRLRAMYGEAGPPTWKSKIKKERIT